MPNWCGTTIKIEAESSAIEQLMHKFETAMRENPGATEFGDNWLGNLLLHIGYTKKDIETVDKAPSCRGMITWIERISPTVLVVDTVTAYEPMVRCIKEFVDAFVDNAVITYAGEEPGCNIYETNDPETADTVYVHLTERRNITKDLKNLLLDIEGMKREVAEQRLSEYLGQTGSLEEFETILKERYKTRIHFTVYEFVEI